MAEEVEEEQRVPVSEAEVAQKAPFGSAAVVRVAVDETGQAAHVDSAVHFGFVRAGAGCFLLSRGYVRHGGVEERSCEAASLVERQAEVFSDEAEVVFDFDLVSGEYFGAEVLQGVGRALRLDELSPELVVALGDALHNACRQHDINIDTG